MCTSCDSVASKESGYGSASESEQDHQQIDYEYPKGFSKDIEVRLQLKSSHMNFLPYISTT